MTDQAIVFSLSTLLCTFFAYRFIRAVYRRRITSRAALLGWGVFFSLYLSVALSIDDFEISVDSLFGGQPVALLTRTLLGFTAAYLVYIGMRQLYPGLPRLRWFVVRFSAVVAICLVLMVIWSARTNALNPAELSLYIRGIRAIPLIAWLTIMLLPPVIVSFRREKTHVPRFRMILVVITHIALAMQLASELAWVFALQNGSDAAPGLLRFERISSYVSYLLLFIMLIPYDVLQPIFYPNRMRVYLRLKRLRRVVVPRAESAGQLKLMHPDDLDMATYDQVVDIFDHYRKLPDDAPLRAKIQRVIDRDEPYAALVRDLARIRV